MKTGVLFISDIHIGLGNAEDEGLVLDAFVKDAIKQIRTQKYDDVFIFIGGDLINVADSNEYSKFDAVIVKPLVEQLQIPRQHIIVTLGNHEVEQSKVRDFQDDFMSIVDSRPEEHEFNDIIHQNKNQQMLLSKFHNVEKYIKEQLGHHEYNLLGYGIDINESWATYCLNTSLFSAGSLNQKDDRGLLSINTRDLYEWVKNKAGKSKILLMHHPFEMMTDWSNSELKKIIKNNFDVVLSGHLHEQDLICQNLFNEKFIYCQAPQLFTKKTETSGYCIVEVEDRSIPRVIYREWFNKQQRFRVGLSFTEADTGIVELMQYQNPSTNHIEDKVAIVLQSKFEEAMSLYNDHPIKWIDRYVSTKRFDHVSRLKDIDLISEIELIKKNTSAKIVSTPQFGLTCYAYHFLITLWEEYAKFGLYIDGNRISLKKIESLVSSLLLEYGKTKECVKWIVVDNWHLPKKEAKFIWDYFKQTFPDIPILLLNQVPEIYFNDTEEFGDELYDVPAFYLAPLKFEQERQLVEHYNQIHFIGDNSAVLKRMDQDILDFNMPKSPLSCATLLTVFSDNFDENLINRTAVLNKFLNVIFDNTHIPTYKSTYPDLQDCEYCLGYFCSTIINDAKLYYFSRDFFVEKVRYICRANAITLDASRLFDILQMSKILIDYGNNYCFRFSFWVYYFAAIWMHHDSIFANTMLSNQTYMHFPDLMEFYTGYDRNRLDAAKIVEKDLNHIIECVRENAGIDENLNPFAVLKYNPSEKISERILTDLDQNVAHSNLPQTVKDSLADTNYNPSLFFHQDIDKVYENFSVGHLIRSIEIASKVLRNSDYIGTEAKLKLMSTIISSWKLLSTIIYLVSKLFSKQRYIQLPGYGFTLGDGFSDDEDTRTIQIITAIPTNIIILFKECIYSFKLSDIFVLTIQNEQDKVKKHLEASLLIYKQPVGWDKVIREYIKSVNKDSYYIGTMIELMQKVLYCEDLDTSERNRMITLAKTAVFKTRSNKGLMPNSIQEVNSISLLGTKDLDKCE